MISARVARAFPFIENPGSSCCPSDGGSSRAFFGCSTPLIPAGGEARGRATSIGVPLWLQSQLPRGFRSHGDGDRRDAPATTECRIFLGGQRESLYSTQTTTADVNLKLTIMDDPHESTRRREAAGAVSVATLAHLLIDGCSLQQPVSGVGSLRQPAIEDLQLGIGDSRRRMPEMPGAWDVERTQFAGSRNEDGHLLSGNGAGKAGGGMRERGRQFPPVRGGMRWGRASRPKREKSGKACGFWLRRRPPRHIIASLEV